MVVLLARKLAWIDHVALCVFFSIIILFLVFIPFAEVRITIWAGTTTSTTTSLARALWRRDIVVYTKIGVNNAIGVIVDLL